jgi:hypothetical protein
MYLSRLVPGVSVELIGNDSQKYMYFKYKVDRSFVLPSKSPEHVVTLVLVQADRCKYQTRQAIR